MGMNTTPHGVDENGKLAPMGATIGSDGNPVGKVIVRSIGTGKLSKNRFLDLATTYASATNSATWPSTDVVTELYLTWTLDDNTTVNLIGDKDGVCEVNFDATSDAVAGAWFAQGASGTLSYPNIELIPGVRTKITFASYLTRLDALPIATGNLLIEAS